MPDKFKIKSLMVLKGLKQRSISRALKIKPASVSLVVSGQRKSARIQKAIADALGMGVEELWEENNKTKVA